MKWFTQKELETKNFIEEYIDKNGYSPTYRLLAESLWISVMAAFCRCKKFKSLMWEKLTQEDKEKPVIVREVYRVPHDKLEEFWKLRNMISNLLK